MTLNRELRPPALFANEQLRMARLQVYNWGTFSDLHEVPISERGFLIVGRSGAGKSTLLDAFSALLVPPRWIDFNGAAREADRAGRDRNLVSYIRGAWAAQSDAASGECATRYLRAGTTWSALALNYRNALGHEVVLVQLFWLRGNANGNTDVKRYFLIFERAFDLRELGDFGSGDFDLRQLKQRFPDAYARDEFGPYCERFRSLLGIESEMALRLLHKTQSAKNLGDLNTFLRDFMLDKPETFGVAERLVGEFGELNAAHQALLTAREQVRTLAPARQHHQRMQALQLQRDALEELGAGMNGYRELRRVELLTEELAALDIDAQGLAAQAQRQQGVLDNRSAALRDLEHQRREAGGEQIAHWESEKTSLESQRVERMRRRTQAVDASKALGWTFPSAPQGFSELLGKARRELDDWGRADAAQEQAFMLDRARTEAQHAHAALAREIAALERQPSNIPASMIALRREIANAIGVAEAALPFIGELIDVKADEAPWRGALERVLHDFALAILVDEEHYGALAEYVNAADLGQRLAYCRSGRAEAAPARAPQPDSLVFKLNVKPGHHAGWLQAELRQRFDYDCVDSLEALHAAGAPALTREGQLKHDRARHEKDDRASVDARQHWLLGFDNHAKLAICEQQQYELHATIAGLQERLDGLRRQRAHSAARALHCQTLVNLQWREVDVLPLADRIAALERQLQSAREGSAVLQRVDDLLGQQRALVQQAEASLRDSIAEHKACLRDMDEQRRQLTALQLDHSLLAPTPRQRQGLDQRYAALAAAPRLRELDGADRAVGKALNADIAALGGEIALCEKSIENRFADFIRNWKADADGLDAAVGAAPDFLSKLARLETEDLPARERRFFALLQSQSTQNLAVLANYLNDGRTAILERMDLVNESLRQVPFNQSANQRTYLHIQPGDRQLPEVREFKQDIQRALNHAGSDDPAFAEARFVALRQLVERLASQEPEQRRWREAVLDVRQHVEFIGRELDEAGAEVEVYRSGAGKSGGQRQKLATTCLAAALRYQLGGSAYGLPIYAPVVLDEAFDKADNEFTALAMNIFAKFGFQMIVATPLKSVMTLEPFIGGACFVDIRDRRVSGVLTIEYDEQRQRLRLPEQARDEAAHA